MKLKHVIVGAVLLIACIILVLLDKNKVNTKEICVYDCAKKQIAIIKLNKDEVSYDCDKKVFAYVDMAFSEAVDYVMEAENIKRDKAIKFLFDKKIQIYTYMDEEINNKLADVINDIEENYGAGIGVSVNDMYGNVCACYASNVEKNYADKRFYAGSTIKPLSVYGPAIDNGTVNWSTLVKDEPYKTIKTSEGDMVEWPQNADGITYATYSVQYAIQRSINTIAVKTLADYGIMNSIDLLKNKFGIKLDVEESKAMSYGEDEVLANLALGYIAEGVSAKEMGGYFDTFLGEGVYTKAHTLYELRKNDDTEYYVDAIQSTEVFSAQTAYICNRLLQTVVSEGGTAKSAYMEDMQLCGKTGTTDDFMDNWFVGYDDEYVCAAWVGNASETDKISAEEIDANEMAHKLPTQICRDFFAAMGGDGFDYPELEGVVKKNYCKKTGLLAGDKCEKTEIGYYNEKYLPDVCEENE